ncbi:hypothetical protein I8D64_15975 [Brachybacterium sp. MASK1Z-5]|uniref:Uncharacterized protein n=1 Tax=Brachybacterium halotolerans TaxID=2795215 RepID=A0ABS1BE24_9MICO|nr:hypothetical protein [Brachybacterium halotolerans]MBK0332901.1 hypothetical protein [Brachybacterium halotolerans]
MLTLSGSGLLRDVRPEPAEDGCLEGVSILLDAQDVGLPSTGVVTVHLHWFCGEDEAAMWLELARWGLPPRCWFSGVGPLIDADQVTDERASGPYFDLVARMVALDVMAMRRVGAKGGE